MAKLMYDKHHYLRSRAFMQRFERVAKHTPETLWLGYRIEHHMGIQGDPKFYGKKLKKRYPDSKETTLLLEMERDGQ